MFEKVLIANCGDLLPCGSAAAQPNRPVGEAHVGGFAAEYDHV